MLELEQLPDPMSLTATNLVMQRAVHIPLAFSVLVFGACEGSTQTILEDDSMALARAESWTRVTDPALDVFADQRPADAICDDCGWGFDPVFQSLVVQTDVCDYLTLRQLTLEPLEPGDVVEIDGFHGVLVAEEPATGYMALALDGEIVWEFRAPIPSDAAIIDEQFTVDRSYPLGTDLQFHVHNHGPNTWDLIAVLVTHAP